MATAIVTMIVSAGINALAFSGSNFLFSSMSGGEEERKRHDLAVEQLSSARDKWNEKRLKNLDYINTKLRNEQHATNTFSDVDYAMKEYAKYNSINHLPYNLNVEPKLSDFYTPSESQQDIEILIMLGTLTATGFAVYYYNKKK